MCLCYSCGLPESGDREKCSPPVSLTSYSHLQHCFSNCKFSAFVLCEMFVICCQEVQGECGTARMSGKVNTVIVINQCCPTKVNTGNYSVRNNTLIPNVAYSLCVTLHRSYHKIQTKTDFIATSVICKDKSIFVIYFHVTHCCIYIV